jgi:ribonuclease E
MIEETLLRGGTHNLTVRTRSDIAIYVLNHKRAHLRDLEERFRIAITINADAAMGGQTPFMIERGEQVHSVEQARAIAAAQPALPALIEPEEDEAVFAEEEDEAEAEAEAHEGSAETETEDDEGETEERGEASADTEGHDDMRDAGSGEGVRRRRRRRRRGRGGEGREAREGGPFSNEAAPEHAGAHHEGDEANGFEAGEAAEREEPHGESGEPREQGAHANGDGDGDRRRRRRGRRGGRRNRRGREGEERFASDLPRADNGEHGAIEPELAGTGADFGGPPVAHEPTEPVASHEPSTLRETAHAPDPAPAAAAESEPPPVPELPRRRSTVREPVPFITDEGPAAYVAPSAPPSQAPSPAPELTPAAAQEPPQDDASKPRRTGWWSKRVLGG